MAASLTVSRSDRGLISSRRTAFRRIRLSQALGTNPQYRMEGVLQGATADVQLLAQIENG